MNREDAATTSSASGSRRPRGRGRRTQQQRSAESTERLVAAAIKLIAEKGFANTSAAEIGERAGYSRSMVQFRWGGKDALLESLLRDEYETRLLPGGSERASGLERVLSQVDHLDRETAANPELMRGFFALCFESVGPLPSLSSWISDWLERYQAETAAAIALGFRDGSVRSDLDAAAEARTFVAAGLGHAFRWMVAPDRIGFAGLMAEWRDQVRSRLAAEKSPQ